MLDSTAKMGQLGVEQEAMTQRQLSQISESASEHFCHIRKKKN